MNSQIVPRFTWNNTKKADKDGRADKDGKIVILNYDDYDEMMTRELQQFEKLDVSVDGSDNYLEKVIKDCNKPVVKLHAIGELKDELLLPITGMKC